MKTIPFRHEFSFQYTRVDQLSPLIRRVVARNPSPFTFHGTGTYIVGRGTVAVIDPGPDLPEHIEALQHALAGEQVSHILVTHTHRDHSPASRPLAQLVGAKIYAYGPHGSGVRRRRADADSVEVEEGGDMEFVADVELRHGDLLTGPGWTLESVYTPGHTSNHLCFRLHEERTLFSGDHVMAWSTSVISPPDGHLGDYLNSLEHLATADDQRYWPTHGPSIDEPKPFLRALLYHRRLRQAQVEDCVQQGLQRIDQMLPVIYRGLAPELMPAAARSLLASVINLVEQRRLQPQQGDEVTLASRYRLVPGNKQ